LHKYAPHAEKMNKIDDIFDKLDDWRHLPAYQLERRADVFFSIYLPELLEERYGFEIEGLVPEFPLRIGTITSKADTAPIPILAGAPSSSREDRILLSAPTTFKQDTL
jgi:hypothetical protein